MLAVADWRRPVGHATQQRGQLPQISQVDVHRLTQLKPSLGKLSPGDEGVCTKSCILCLLDFFQACVIPELLVYSVGFLCEPQWDDQRRLLNLAQPTNAFAFSNHSTTDGPVGELSNSGINLRSNLSMMLK